ncbi:POT family MFS transporter [Myxococcota bacterium]|nr:POT family MFS transporter [Myxococcota bacterium]
MAAPQTSRNRLPYASEPSETTGMPSGIPYIISNEAAERFSYYGMRAVLVVFMTRHLLGADGMPDPMGDEEAKGWYHLFTASVYFFPLLGAILSDGVFGKYRTIMTLSVVYCLGHLVLALDSTRMGLALGLGLIAVGAGGIKPCVSAHVGDQFGKANQKLLTRVFSWFYFSINLGAFASTLLTPVLLRSYGPHVAFGVPGVLMALATLAFWMGRHRFVHVPPAGKSFIREVLSKEGLRSVGRLMGLYLFVAMFWALFDQTGSAWVLQAEHLDRRFMGIEWLPSQLQAMNPLLVMLLIPLFTYVLYPAIHRYFPLTPLRKIAIGFLITVPAFLIPAWLEVRIEAGEVPSIGWQVLAYLILTSAEVFVSITCLEFSYTQAPNRMKSFVMALNLLSVTAGNLFTAGVNFMIIGPDGSSLLDQVDYYLFFAGAMLLTAIAFIGYARGFQETRYIQGSKSSTG